MRNRIFALLLAAVLLLGACAAPESAAEPSGESEQPESAAESTAEAAGQKDFTLMVYMIGSDLEASAAVAASAAATAGLDSSGNHILTQILISGIVDLWLFTVDILVCCGSIFRFVLMKIHRCIDQSERYYHNKPVCRR